MNVHEWLADLAVGARSRLVLMDGDRPVGTWPATWERRGPVAVASATFEAEQAFRVTAVATESGAVLERFDKPVQLPAGFRWDYTTRIALGAG